MLEKYRDFPMRFDCNEPGVLALIIDAPNLNVAVETVHREFPRVWIVIDADPDTRAVLVRGAGKAFAAGGSFDLIEEQIKDPKIRHRLLRESRALPLAGFAPRSHTPARDRAQSSLRWRCTNERVRAAANSPSHVTQ